MLGNNREGTDDQEINGITKARSIIACLTAMFLWNITRKRKFEYDTMVKSIMLYAKRGE